MRKGFRLFGPALVLVIMLLLLLAAPTRPTTAARLAPGEAALLPGGSSVVTDQVSLREPGGIHVLPLPILARDQVLIVVTCKYADTDDPAISSEEWETILEDAMNDYFEEATEGQTTFDIRPVPGVCEFDYEYNEIEDDQLVRVVETFDAIRFAEATDPNIFLEGQRLLIFVNRMKRAVASPQIYHHQTPSGLEVLLSMSLVPEPTADGRTRVTDGDIGVIAHEVSHQLGLPDLYRYYGDGTDLNPLELWGEMAFDNLQNYSGFSRTATGWLPGDQQAVIRKPIIGTTDRDIVLRPPTSSGGAGTELIRLELDPSGLDLLPGGYLIEARPKINLDETITDTSIVTGPLPPPEEVQGRWGDFRGLPAEYEGGVLISKATDLFPAFTLFAQPLTSLNVIEVQPRAITEPLTPTNTLQLSQAALLEGDSFEDEEQDLTVTVEDARADGSFVVNVRWEGLPIPDVAAEDIWLDNPVNGFGTFFTPVVGGVPTLFGDPIGFVASINWVNGIPVPTVSTDVHRLVVRARNVGTVTAGNVRGTVFILDPLLLLAAIIDDPFEIVDTLEELAIQDTPVVFGNLAAGVAANAAINYDPGGPFMAFLHVDEIPNEFTPLNNFYYESFIVSSLSAGSPYPPMVVEFPVRNEDMVRHVFMPTVAPLPEGWRYTWSPTYAVLEPGEEETLRLTIRPPDSRDAPPPLLQDIYVLAWMDAGDSFIPVSKMDAYAALTHRTRLTLTRIQAGRIGGLLTYRTPQGTNAPIPNAPVIVNVSGNNGFRNTIRTLTDASGRFVVAVPTTAGVRFGAIANYPGSQPFAASFSAPFFVEETNAPTIISISPSTVTAGSRNFQLTVTGLNFPRTSVVRLGGVALPTTFLRSTQLRVSVPSSSVSTTRSTEITVQDTATNLTSAPRPFIINPIRVGQSEVTPSAGQSMPGIETSWVISWTHPSEGWRALDYLDFRLALGDDAPLWVRLTESREGETDSSTFSLLDREGNVVASGAPGAYETLESDTAILYLERSGHEAEPGSPTVNITISASLKPSAGSGLYNLEVYEREDSGAEQGPDIVGEWTLPHLVSLPFVTR